MGLTPALDSSESSALASAPEFDPSQSMPNMSTAEKHVDAPDKDGKQQTPAPKRDTRTEASNTLPTPQSLPRSQDTTRKVSTIIYASTPSRPRDDKNYNGYFETAFQTPNLARKARRGSSRIDQAELEDGPYDPEDSDDISPGMPFIQRRKSQIATKHLRPGRLRRIPTTHPLSPAPKTPGTTAVAPPSPSNTASTEKRSSEDDTMFPRDRGSSMHMLPLAHLHVSRIMDPFAPAVRFFYDLACRAGVPGIEQLLPSAGPRPLPEQLVSPSYKSFRSVPNSAGVYVAPSPRFDNGGIVRKVAQVPALRIYSSDYALALRGEYGYDHRVTSLHFRLRFSGVPYADCPAIWFLAPNWQLPYIWSSYPHQVERYPFWVLNPPKNSLETRLMQERMKDHGHIIGGGERKYMTWGFTAARGITWAAGGLESSLKELINKAMIPELNFDLKSDDKAKDIAAIETVEKLSWLVTYERQGQFILRLLLCPAPLPFYVITLFPHVFLLPLFFCHWLMTWLMLLFHGTTRVDPWVRWRQKIDLIATLSGMVNRGLAIAESRAKQDQQFGREKQRREEALTRIRIQMSHKNSDDADTSSGASPASRNVSDSPGVGGIACQNKRNRTSKPQAHPSNHARIEEGQWISGSPRSISTSIESVCGTEDSVNEDTGLLEGKPSKNSAGEKTGSGSSNKEPGLKGPWWILGRKQPTEADFVVYGFLATMLATPTQPQITHLLRSSPILVMYMSRIHNTYFPDFPSPKLVPDPDSSLKANMVHNLSRYGVKSCIKHAVSYISQHYDPRNQAASSQDSKYTAQSEQQAQSKANESELMSPIHDKRRHPFPAPPPTTPIPTARPDCTRPGQYLEHAKRKLSMAVSTYIDSVPVVNLNLSVLNRASKANIVEISTEDGLLLPLGNVKRRFSILTPSDTPQSGMAGQQAMSRFGSFSQPQVLPGGGRIVAPGELPPSPPMAFPETPMNHNSGIPRLVLDTDTPSTGLDKVPTSAVGGLGLGGGGWNGNEFSFTPTDSYEKPPPPTPININNRAFRVASIAQETPTRLPLRKSSIQFIEPPITRRSSIAVTTTLHKSELRNFEYRTPDFRNSFSSPAVKVRSHPFKIPGADEDKEQSTRATTYVCRRRSSPVMPVTIEEVQEDEEKEDEEEELEDDDNDEEQQ